MLYGPNSAMIEECVALLKKSFLPQDSNDFSIVTMTPEQLKQDPAALADEMGSFGFFASSKFIHIRDADDPVLRPVQSALELPNAGHFLVLSAGELTPRSALRQWAEKAPDVACIPCYMLEGPRLARFVQDRFTQHGARIASDAITLIIERLGTDLSALGNLVPQLIDYAGTKPPVITAEHVEALLVDQTEQEMDSVTQAVADRALPALDYALHNLVASDVSLIAVLRVLQNYFYRLRLVRAAVANGENSEEAIKQLRPPVFFKMKTAFMRHLRNWSLEQIDEALSEFIALEAACKKTGTPELDLVHYRLIRLCLRKQK